MKLQIKSKCFPEFSTTTPIPADDSITNNSSGELSDDSAQMKSSTVDTSLNGKITCRVCGQSLAGSNASLECHLKNHLNYKVISTKLKGI